MTTLPCGAVLIPRDVAERCQALAERVLLFTEIPDQELVDLQHQLADLLGPQPAPAERSIQT